MRRRTVQYVHRRQETTIPSVPSSGGVSGSTEIDTAVSQTTALVADNSAVDTGAAITSATISVASVTSSTSSATASASATSSASSSLSWSTVIGICVGVFAALAVFLFLFYYFCVRRIKAPKGGRKSGPDTARQRSGRELWVKMEDADGTEKYSMKQSPNSFKTPATAGGGGGGGGVARSITVKSSKSGKTFKSVGWGANLGLADTFRTGEAAPQLEFTDRDMGTGHGFTKSASSAAAMLGGEKAKEDTMIVAAAAAYPYQYPKPPPITSRPPVDVDVARVLSNAVSWDGDTVADGASYLSLERANMVGALKDKLPSPMSPSQSMVVSYQTPPAVENRQHQWEAAEVISPERADDAYSGVESAIGSSEPTIQHPFASHYATSTARTSVSEDTVRRQPTNPFGDNNPFRSVEEDDEAYAIAPSNTSLSYLAATSDMLPPPPASAGSTNSFFSIQSSLPVRPDAFSALEHTAAHHERMESNERAMASLIAALDISPEEARERMSAAAMMTPRASALSSVTGESSLTMGTEHMDEEGMRRFPAPPATQHF